MASAGLMNASLSPLAQSDAAQSDTLLLVAAVLVFLALLAFLLRWLSKSADKSKIVDADDNAVPIPPSRPDFDADSTPAVSPKSLAEAFSESTLQQDRSFEQFPGPSSADVLDVVIGLDFGTSCSKVVIRSTKYGGRAFAVPFGKLSGGHLQYLLPTRVYEQEDGRFALDGTSPATEHVDLKRALMNEPNSPSHQETVVGYLALVLRKARIWFIETQRSGYGDVRLRWALNMGIPSAWYDDSDLRKTFESVARRAWLISLNPIATRARARDCLESTNSSVDIDVNVVPEIGAEVVGYLNSSEYRSGLHVIVDVGGGTLDVCGFVLHDRDDENAFELFEARVKNLGAYVLHERRYDAMITKDIEPALTRRMDDLLQPIPDASNYVRGSSPSAVQALKRVDEAYTSECVGVITDVLRELRRDRDPNSPHWDSGLPVFYAGGGSYLKQIEDALSEASERFTRACNVSDFKRCRLSGIRLYQVDHALLPRLAVAYGLSFDVDDIGRFTKPSEHEDIPPPPTRRPMPYTSKDDV
jgi:hypothetical protein